MTREAEIPYRVLLYRGGWIIHPAQTFQTVLTLLALDEGGGAARQQGEGFAREDLLLGGRPRRAAMARERDGPVQHGGEAVAEAGQVGEVSPHLADHVGQPCRR